MIAGVAPSGSSKTLTDYEHDALGERFDLADGHARQDLTVAELAIVDRLDELFLRARTADVVGVERGFLRAFFELAGQPSWAEAPTSLVQYSSSMSIEIAANVLRRTGRRTVGLISPTFDNIPSILRRHDLELRPLAEDAIANGKLDPAAYDAILVVCPNNPTGFEIDRDVFSRLARSCALAGTILVVDFSFRAFSEYRLWDQYEVFVLPGEPFFWADPEPDRGYVRIALLRPRESFMKAIDRLRALLEEYR
jgi:aspartate/methionine/tyrosine aminotransferase